MLFEISSSQENLQLQLEKGTKNTHRLQICLYINNRLLEKLHLHSSHSWDLETFNPGNYRLLCEQKEAIQFKIKNESKHQTKRRGECRKD